MTSLAEQYIQRVDDILTTIGSTQNPGILAAAGLIADAIVAGGILQTFGTGHSRSVALEAAGRAGGLVAVNQLWIRDLAYYGTTPIADLLDPKVERDPGLAEAILDLATVGERDVFLIVSNSGHNAAITEMARTARVRGHKVIGITSFDHSLHLTAEHGSDGLAELADVAIDTCAPYGDAVLDVGGIAAVGVSTLAGVFIVQTIVAGVLDALSERGVDPDVFESANTPGTDGRNAARLERYGSRIRLGDA